MKRVELGRRPKGSEADSKGFGTQIKSNQIVGIEAGLCSIMGIWGQTMAQGQFSSLLDDSFVHYAPFVHELLKGLPSYSESLILWSLQPSIPKTQR